MTFVFAYQCIPCVNPAWLEHRLLSSRTYMRDLKISPFSRNDNIPVPTHELGNGKEMMCPLLLSLGKRGYAIPCTLEHREHFCYEVLVNFLLLI